MILATRLAGIAVVVALTASCSDGCRNTIVDRVASPSGVFDAVVFERNCGATTGFSTQVSVLRAGEAPRDGGNAFVSDKGRQAMGWNGPQVDVAWSSDSALIIRHDPTARVFPRPNHVDEVAITLQPLS